jgi:hypothetical protein
MFQRRTRAMVGTLVIVLVTVGLVGLAQAKPYKPRFSVLPSDNTWVLDSTTALQWQKTAGNAMPWETAATYCTDLVVPIWEVVLDCRRSKS